MLGCEPEIYFYSHRRAATGYIYTYPLMEPQPFAAEMQREMIREIERAAPEYVVYVSTPTSWEKTEQSDRTIFDWLMRYTCEQMDLDGVVDILPGGKVESHWELGGGEYRPRTTSGLAIFKRRRFAIP